MYVKPYLPLLCLWDRKSLVMFLNDIYVRPFKVAKIIAILQIEILILS